MTTYLLKKVILQFYIILTHLIKNLLGLIIQTNMLIIGNFNVKMVLNVPYYIFKKLMTLKIEKDIDYQLILQNLTQVLILFLNKKNLNVLSNYYLMLIFQNPILIKINSLVLILKIKLSVLKLTLRENNTPKTLCLKVGKDTNTHTKPFYPANLKVELENLMKNLYQVLVINN